MCGGKSISLPADQHESRSRQHETGQRIGLEAFQLLGRRRQPNWPQVSYHRGAQLTHLGFT